MTLAMDADRDADLGALEDTLIIDHQCFLSFYRLAGVDMPAKRAADESGGGGGKKSR